LGPVTYADIISWRMNSSIPDIYASVTVNACFFLCNVNTFKSCSLQSMCNCCDCTSLFTLSTRKDILLAVEVCHLYILCCFFV